MLCMEAAIQSTEKVMCDAVTSLFDAKVQQEVQRTPVALKL